MVIYEVLSGQVPFRLSGEFVAMEKVIEGVRPERPEGEIGMLFTDGIWELVHLCWMHQPGDRISAKDLLLGIERNSSPLRPSPDTGRDVGNVIRSGAMARNSGMLSSFHSRITVDRPCGVQIFQPHAVIMDSQFPHPALLLMQVRLRRTAANSEIIHKLMVQRRVGSLEGWYATRREWSKLPPKSSLDFDELDGNADLFVYV